MRKSNTQKIGQVIEEYLEALKIAGKVKEIRLVNSWEDVVGKMIARSTDNIYIKNKCLHVSLRSSVIRGELMLIRGELIKALNNRVGEEIITEIRLH